MADVMITYFVPVQVIVDLDEMSVERVIVEDELVERDTTLEPTDPGGASISPMMRKRALAIAEDEEWPAWEFGW